MEKQERRALGSGLMGMGAMMVGFGFAFCQPPRLVPASYLIITGMVLAGLATLVFLELNRRVRFRV